MDALKLKKEPKVTTTMRVPVRILDAAKAMAKREEVSRSRILEYALEQFLAPKQKAKK